MIIFRCKTTQAYTFKITSEILQNNLKCGTFTVNAKGITLRQMNNNRSILINIVLDADNFSMYKFKHDGDLRLGLNLSHLYKMLRSCKKKDTIELFVDDKTPTELGIKVSPKDNNRITTSYIQIQDTQTMSIDIPDGYTHPVILPSTEYHKSIKDLMTISQKITVVSKNFYIKFQCNACNVIQREVTFGEMNDSDSDNNQDDVDITMTYEIEHLSRISKISGLSNTIQIYSKEDAPLLLKSNVGSLGYIQIYVKSCELIDEEVG